MVFYFLSETELAFLWQWRKKMPFPHLGDFWGKRWSGKNHFRSRVQLACATRLFLLDHRTTCTVFSGVRHVCHDNDGRFGAGVR